MCLALLAAHMVQGPGKHTVQIRGANSNVYRAQKGTEEVSVREVNQVDATCLKWLEGGRLLPR